MTWVATVQNGRPDDAAKAKLNDKRAALVKQIETLSMQPMGKSQSAILGRQEDLLKLASKVKSIDKQLGRI